MREGLAGLPARVEAFAREESLLRPGDRVLVAVSGGADSLCLLDVLMAMREPWGLTVEAAHFDHCLRAGSAEDAAFVSAWCRERGVPVSAGAWHQAHEAAGHGGLEAAAHRARYDFLQAVADERGAHRIAFGHTADDQAETVLMHLLRGSGLRGLVGLAPRNGKAIRPLLTTSAAETRAWCRFRGIDWREDPTNAEPVAFRNVVRRDLVPVLRRLNPALDRAVSRTTGALRVDYTFLRDAAEAARRSCVERRGDAFVIRRQAYGRTPEAVRRHVIQGLFEEVLPEGRQGDYEHVLAADRLVMGGRGGASLSLPGRVELRLEYDVAVLERQPSRSAGSTPASGYPPPSSPLGTGGGGQAPALRETLSVESPADDPARRHPQAALWESAELPIPGAVAPAGAGWRLVAAWCEPPRELAPADANVAWLDPARVRPPLLVRPWLPGDRFVPSGMRHSQKVQDLFVNAKVPRNRRRLVPVVLSESTIVWVGGVRLAEAARLRFDGSVASTPAIRLELRPLERERGG